MRVALQLPLHGIPFLQVRFPFQHHHAEGRLSFQGSSNENSDAYHSAVAWNRKEPVDTVESRSMGVEHKLFCDAVEWLLFPSKVIALEWIPWPLEESGSLQLFS